MRPPSPVQVIPRSSVIFDYPSKRRKTDESMPSAARSNSHNRDSPSRNFSLPLQSPKFTFSGPQSGSQTFDRPLGAHGSSHSQEFVSLLGSARPSDHGQAHGTITSLGYSGATGSDNFNATNVDMPNSAEGSYDLLSPRFWTQQSVWPYPSLQEACLMRYYVENFAHWVSLPFWHYAKIRPAQFYSSRSLTESPHIITMSIR